MDELCERWLKQREGDRLPGNEGRIVQALDAAADAVARARVFVKGEKL
jgi:hypothetical protein